MIVLLGVLWPYLSKLGLGRDAARLISTQARTKLILRIINTLESGSSAHMVACRPKRAKSINCQHNGNLVRNPLDDCEVVANARIGHCSLAW
jgi:hypothetical protein